MNISSITISLDFQGQKEFKMNMSGHDVSKMNSLSRDIAKMEALSDEVKKMSVSGDCVPRFNTKIHIHEASTIGISSSNPCASPLQEKTRKVGFYPDFRNEYVESWQPLDNEEIKAQWYSGMELGYLLKQCKVEAARAEQESDQIDEAHIRGLELFTKEGRLSHLRVVRNSVQAVLEEQERLRKKGAHDPHSIQKAYQKRSAYRQRMAHSKALWDAQHCSSQIEEPCGSEYVHGASRKRFSIMKALRVKRIRRESRRCLAAKNYKKG